MAPTTAHTPVATIPDAGGTVGPWRPHDLDSVVRFTPTVEELAALFVDVCRGDADFRAECRQDRKARVLFVAVLGTLLGLTLVLIQAVFYRWPVFFPVYLAIVPALAATGVYLVFRSSLDSLVEHRAFKRGWHIARTRGWFFSRDTEIGLCAHGVFASTDRETSCVHWAALDRVEVSDSGVVLRARRMAAVLIPLRAFASTEAAHEFAGRVKARQADRSLDAASVSARLLVDLDVPCPECGYNLRGAKGNLCPECGRTFDIELLERAAWRARTLSPRQGSTPVTPAP